MTARHHPDQIWLGAFAAGTLDLGQHVAVATHLAACPHCRGFVQAMEQVGGEMLRALPPTPMADAALARVEAQLERAEPASRKVETNLAETLSYPGLPDFVRRYRGRGWRWVAPRVSVLPIELPEPSPTRVFLLKAGAGTRMLPHSHTSLEMTCVLTGAFSHDGGRFGPGDFDYGDEETDHRPVVEPGEDCICLVAMHGELKLAGIVGRLMQPLVRL
jgi:putative transcriptional regulator